MFGYSIIYLLLIVAPIGTFIHELGHGIGAKLRKADHIRLSLGLGKRIKTFQITNITIHIHALFFIGGSLQSKRAFSYTHKDMLIITILGPICSGIFAIIFFLVYNIYSNQFIFLLSLFNAWIAITNLFPFSIRGNDSDGYTIFKIIRYIYTQS